MQIRYIRDYLQGSYIQFLSNNIAHSAPFNQTTEIQNYVNYKNWVQIKAISDEKLQIYALGTSSYNGSYPSAAVIVGGQQIPIAWGTPRGHALIILDTDNKTPIFNQTYDTYLYADQINSLAAKLNILASTYPNNYWILVSQDAIGINATLTSAFVDLGLTEFNTVTGRFSLAAVGRGGECLANETDKSYIVNGSTVLRAELFINGKNLARGASVSAISGFVSTNQALSRLTNGKSNMTGSTDCVTSTAVGEQWVQVDLGALVDIEYIHIWYGFTPITYSYHFGNISERWLYKKHKLAVSTDNINWTVIQNYNNPLVGLACGTKYYIQDQNLKGQKLTLNQILQIQATINENIISTADLPKFSLADIYSPRTKNLKAQLLKIYTNATSVKNVASGTAYLNDDGSKYEINDINTFDDMSIKFSNEYYGCSGSTCVAICMTTCSSTCVDTCGPTTCGFTCSSACGDTSCTHSCGTSACSSTCGDSTCSNTCGTGSCSTTCGSGCSGGCAPGTCTYVCGGGCSNHCGGKCGLICGNFICGDNCTFSCVGGLLYGCTGCANGCTGTCQNNCNTPCGGLCCGGCAAACTIWCTSACAGACTGPCAAYCGGDCNGGCVSACHGTCSVRCGSSCNTDCTAICGNFCSTVCSSTCSAKCSETCSSNCSNGCTAHCAHEVNA
jgi:hypothetical protein